LIRRSAAAARPIVYHQWPHRFSPAHSSSKPRQPSFFARSPVIPSNGHETSGGLGPGRSLPLPGGTAGPALMTRRSVKTTRLCAYPKWVSRSGVNQASRVSPLANSASTGSRRFAGIRSQEASKWFKRTAKGIPVFESDQSRACFFAFHAAKDALRHRLPVRRKHRTASHQTVEPRGNPIRQDTQAGHGAPWETVSSMTAKRDSVAPMTRARPGGNSAKASVSPTGIHDRPQSQRPRRITYPTDMGCVPGALARWACHWRGRLPVAIARCGRSRVGKLRLFSPTHLNFPVQSH
jgi:hypothetical protein